MLCCCRGRQTANTLESNSRCERAETDCEDTLEREQLVKLPSTGRFEDRFSHCQAAFDRVCIGPAHTGQVCLPSCPYTSAPALSNICFTLFLSMLAFILYRFRQIWNPSPTLHLRPPYSAHTAGAASRDPPHRPPPLPSSPPPPPRALPPRFQPHPP